MSGRAVVLIGGRGRHGVGNIEAKLLAHGVEVTRIEQDRVLLKRVPQDNLALVVLRDVVPPLVRDAAKNLAESSGVPLILVERNWSQAAPAFRQAGIIESVEEEAEVEPEVQEDAVANPAQIHPQIVKAPQPQMAQLPPDVMEAVRLLADAMKACANVQFVTIGRNAGGLQVDFQVVNPTNGSILL